MELVKTDTRIMEKVINIGQMQVDFKSFQFEDNNKHINKMPFSGICLKADTPSDGIPCGSDKPVAFSSNAILNACKSFQGMGVNCVYNKWDTPDEALTGHDRRFKIGVVESAEITADGLNIKGCLWKYDFKDVCFQIKNAKDSLGFSIEVIINDMTDNGDFYLVEDFAFTGVAILYKNLAAFKETQLAAQKRKEVDNSMNEQQFQTFMDAVKGIGESVKTSLSVMDAKLDKIKQKEVKVDFAGVIDAVNKMSAEFAKVTASKVEEKKKEETKVPEKKTEGMQFVGKDDNKEMSLADKIKAIDENPNISFNDKASAKMKAFAESLKAKKSN